MSTRHLFIMLTLVLTTHAFGQSTQFFGVFVGISNYSDTVFNLQYADDDATAMRSYMTTTTGQHWPSVHTVCLTNSSAAKQDILDAITAMPRPGGYEITPLDMFYFSGHGNDPDYSQYPEFPKGILAYNPNQAITPLDLSSRFGSSYNKYCAFIDACYSGMFPGAMGNGVICSSCESSEVSVEDAPRGHGLWTYYLLQGLLKSAAGETDGIVSAEELYDYAYQPTIDRAYAAYSISQHPVIGDHWSGNLNFKDADDQAPEAPLGLSITHDNTPQLHPLLSWTMSPEADVQANTTNGYEVYRREWEGNYVVLLQDWTKIISLSGTTTTYTDPNVAGATIGQDKVDYRVRAVDPSQNASPYSSVVSVSAELNYKIFAGALPDEFRLGESYPNPFNPTTHIRYDLPEPSTVALQILDIQGREVTMLHAGFTEAGSYDVSWNAGGQASGVYFARLAVTNSLGKVVYTKTNKLLLTK